MRENSHDLHRSSVCYFSTEAWIEIQQCKRNSFTKNRQYNHNQRAVHQMLRQKQNWCKRNFELTREDEKTTDTMRTYEASEKILNFVNYIMNVFGFIYRTSNI